ncbi:tyrosine-type recombinase/integrase [Methanocorpusculum vombati]|uniref:Site-specific integrase n=1 Tax=Methanocorpusculum vombati TaxID=3002864 RepID=A0ABT4IKJ7_9EURY|nr:site-specific integrase [Methanocorpusculum vombati]MCZ9319593.1 site-specific integrase [Methanocorpusculum sp.]MCZ0862282.1 site-specific integrase [Methanocorpusculum vombati]MDE2520695.1 site-specific integrase [Methanocorpusculum sp.]MDE2534458.1 site-specific integrase [Methanocorpusculum sp.]MDE2545778.1 site-specific integrase [Methanocorpusculum sp.]
MGDTYYSVSEYIETKRTDNTRKAALYGLAVFFQYLNPVQKTREELDRVSIQYLRETTDHFDQVRDYCVYLVKYTDFTPNTIKNRVNALIHWLRWNRIVFSPAESAIISNILPRAIPVHEDRVISRDNIRSILSHSDTLLQTVILILASSGMRINELLNTRFSDIRPGAPNAIHIPRNRMKAGKAHTYFYSSEAEKSLSEWLKVRDAYIDRAMLKTQYCLKRLAKKADDDLIFPFSYDTLRRKFLRAIEAANLYEVNTESSRTTISFHSFRKWCESTMKLYVPINVVNELIGHDEGLSRSYRRYAADQLRSAYQAAEPHLFILAPEEYAILKGESAHVLREQQATTASLAAEMMKMRAEIEAMREFIKAGE